MFNNDEWSPIPYEEEQKKLKQYKEAQQSRDREAQKRFKGELIGLYVQYGELFKMSDTPNRRSAIHCLQKALQYQTDHPVANYRYAHILFQDKDYAQAAYHFKKAIDGSREESLNDSQVLVANMFLVNCGLLITREALKEVRYMKTNEFVTYDVELIETYSEKMLINSEDMLEQHMYNKHTPAGTTFISRGEFVEYLDRLSDNEVLLYIDDKYYIKFRDDFLALEKHAFYLFYTIIRSDNYVQGKDIASALLVSDLELELTNDNVRQYFRRLSARVPFWEEVIETISSGNRTERRRRQAITYSVLCHSSVVLP